jgi:hypothetical protein
LSSIVARIGKGKENWAAVLLTATQPGIIATIYLSPF